MKLYDIPRGSKIKVEEGMITFNHLDGMYSHCTAEWVKKGEPRNVHLSAGTPLEKEGDHYIIKQ